MARDIYAKLHRCSYCGRPAEIRWDADLTSCNEEVCQTLAYAEMRRRKRVRERSARQVATRA